MQEVGESPGFTKWVLAAQGHIILEPLKLQALKKGAPPALLLAKQREPTKSIDNLITDINVYKWIVHDFEIFFVCMYLVGKALKNCFYIFCKHIIYQEILHNRSKCTVDLGRGMTSNQ